MTAGDRQRRREGPRDGKEGQETTRKEKLGRRDGKRQLETAITARICSSRMDKGREVGGKVFLTKG